MTLVPKHPSDTVNEGLRRELKRVVPDCRVVPLDRLSFFQRRKQVVFALLVKMPAALSMRHGFGDSTLPIRHDRRATRHRFYRDDSVVFFARED